MSRKRLAAVLLVVILVVVLGILMRSKSFDAEGLVVEIDNGVMQVDCYQSQVHPGRPWSWNLPIRLDSGTILRGAGGERVEAAAIEVESTWVQASGAAPLWQLLLGLPVHATVDVRGSV